MLTNVDKLMKQIKFGGSDHVLVEFVMSRNVGLTKSKVNILNRRPKFQLFKNLVDKILRDALCRDRGTDQSWQLFKDTFLRVQELSILTGKKSSREGRKLSWLRKDQLRCSCPFQLF